MLVAFARQLLALIHKNLLVTVVRRPIGFLLYTYGFPLAILGLLLSITSFLPTFNSFGVSPAAPIRPLGDTVDRKLVIVRPPELGPDVDRVVEAFTQPVRRELLVFRDDEADLLSLCLPDTRGMSDCHATVLFRDSPMTGPASGRHAWRYTIRADPARNNRNFDVKRHRSDQEDLYLPLQLAINNAITNSSVTPETVVYTPQPEQDVMEQTFNSNAAIVGRIFVFIIIIVYSTIVYRLTAFITAERDGGMSQLIDSMGGGGSIAARVLAWLVTFDIVALPGYIGLGALYQRLVFSSSSASVLIGWQILLGFAINSMTVFLAAFFSKSRMSAIYIIFFFFITSIIAQMYASETKPHPGQTAVFVLSLLLPSANNVYFTQQMSLWQVDGQAAKLGQFPPETTGLWSESYGVRQSTMLSLLMLNIFIYPVLAVVVEKLRHGIHYRRRCFSAKPSDSSGVVARTLELKKRFDPSWIKRVCCCGRRKPVMAVNGVTFQAHRGQIMCLVGPNGSGKTTTLHMMAGFIKPTEGTIVYEARPSQIGICPQQNTLWEELTVEEHVRLWDRIKNGSRSHHELDQLIHQCDLWPKRAFKAKELSGGQKRKLQLACMFVGDASVCLIDECTSGLDPLSRRAIWEILVQQRSKRSIVLTTHFLDEVDVLADQIVLLAQGAVKCRGSSAELKNQHGGGYKVLAPLSARNICGGYPHSTHQDKLVYSVPDSRVAAQMASTLVAVGVNDVAVAGPQFEDVFLNLLGEDEIFERSKSALTADSGFEMTPGRVTSFWTQFRVLHAKRWMVLRRFWAPYIFALIVPLGLTFLLGGMVERYTPPGCDALQDTDPMDVPTLAFNASCLTTKEDIFPGSRGCGQVSVAPRTANASLFGLVSRRYGEMADVDPQAYGSFAVVQNSRDEMLEYIIQNRTRAGYGGVFAGSSNEAPLIVYRIMSWGTQTGSRLLDLWSQMQGNVEINSSQEVIPKARKDADMNGMFYMFLFCLLQVLYPAVFVLYPAIEKARKVRAVQYSNGVRRAPLWAAYCVFDFFWICLLSILLMLIMSIRINFNGPVLLLIPILALYGLAATLMGYSVAHFTNGPLESYLVTLGIGMLSYMIIAISIGVSNGGVSQGEIERKMAGVAFGANLFFPIGNLFRTLLIGFNMMEAGCKGGQPPPLGSMHGFGGPIFYLFLQICALLLLIIWLEGGLPKLHLFGKGKPGPCNAQDFEMNSFSQGAGQARSMVAIEAARAEKAGSDLLRVLHVSKTFGTNRAVDDVTFGLPRGDVMALIGPNGAGKSTTVNMIQAELSPDRGQIMLCQEDGRSPSSRKNLGVCPQYDAPDFMNTREHLTFYARVKGIKDVKANVGYLMDKLGLTPHARTQASKLSGGNKRKLMLAIALMGTPPVVVLDEPTSAMDAVAKRSFWKLIQEIAAERSVLLTTHSMEEADALATRTAIIARRLLAIGTTQSLRERYSNLYYVILVLSTAPTSSPQEMGRIGDWVRDRVAGARLEREMLGGQVRFTFPAGTAGIEGSKPPVASLIETLEREKEALGIDCYSISGPTLENVFLSVVRENNVEEEDGKARRHFWRRLLKR
ncbi:hypothetical protein CDD83_3548 [Cordyceps sp. RAO-2017]|nr:hypothetical protein CDD83_3548 [Cordyceps sp. RAO-2017]